MKRLVRAVLLGLILLPLGAAEKSPLLLVVMDPLSRELACACVKGYGQRDYRKLASRLERDLQQRVSIEFSDDLADTLELAGQRRQVMVIGDRSLVAHGAQKAGLKCAPACELTDLEGKTTLAASIVARADDTARELKDAAGRTFFVGLAEHDERLAATLEALRAAGVNARKPEKHLPYSDAALDLLDSEASPMPLAILPSYAVVMLQGCGSVKPGSLRVIGQSRPTPFITVFLSDDFPSETKEKIVQSLLGVSADGALLAALESKHGFKRLNPKVSGADWPDWRGPARDGRVPKLPATLPSTPKIVWKKASMNGSLAGLTVSGGRLISAERDLGDEKDVFRCLDAETGELLWRIEYPARGTLDYGQSPRAAPVIDRERAYLLGAFGNLRCVNMADGKVLWERKLPSEFGAGVPTWGMCSPPLLVDGLVVVNPGGANASLAALDRETGHTRWTAPGGRAGYSAFIVGTFGGRKQIVGYDEHSLGGWDPATGERLWRLKPPVEGDFNVPTPIAVDGAVLVSTENNGTRLHRFDQSGKILSAPAARFAELAPDTATPVIARGRLFGATHERLYCLDLRQGLRQIWRQEEPALGDHVSLFADDDRVLVVTLGGELILLAAKPDACAVISRMRLFEDDVELYAHPALAGTRLYARGGSSLVCVDLEMN